MKVKGLILAGGEGKRIGGKKPLKLLCGKPLIFWVLKPYLSEDLEVFISVRDKTQEEEIKEALSEEKLPWKKLQFVTDEKWCAGKGPLCGLLSGMKACKEETYLLVSACDQPFLTKEIFKSLIGIAKSKRPSAVVYKAEEKIEPLPGIYSSNLKEILEEFLAQSLKPSFKAFLERIKSQNLLVFLDYSSKIENRFYPFLNINFLKELEAAEKCFSPLKELKKEQ